MKKIPKIYLAEFLNQQIALIKSRVQLAALLFVATFFTGTIISTILLNEKIASHLIFSWLLSICVSIVIFVLSRNVSTIRAAKLSALLLMVMVMAVLTRYYVLENEAPFNVATVYIFVFFAFSLIFPWFPKEIIGVLILHYGAYAIYLLNVPTYLYKNKIVVRELPDYLTGIIVMFLAFWVCFIVIKREREREIENFILLKDVEEKNEQMQKELELATKVHQTLIPKSLSTDLADIAVMYLPISYMGGDYAKFNFIDKNKLLFIICDVTGHGVSAALLVNRLHTEFERSAKEDKQPGSLLKELNDFIMKDFTGINMFLSAFCGLLDFKEKKLYYSNHGHPTQYIYRITQSDILHLTSQTSLLGLPLEDENTYQHEIDFSKGDRILLFTDGITETKNSNNDEYGKEKVESFIRKNYNLQVDQFNQSLLDELNAFKYGNFKDDIFMLNIHIKKVKTGLMSFL